MSRVSSKNTVLVLSNPLDLHTDAVMHYLYKHQPDEVSVVRWHPSEVEAHEVVMDDEGARVWISDSPRSFFSRCLLPFLKEGEKSSPATRE